VTGPSKNCQHCSCGNLVYKRVLKDFRWFIRHHSSVVESAALKKFTNPWGPQFDSGRNHVNSDSHGFEHIDPQSRAVQGTTKTVIRRRKTKSIICKVLRLWSNSEVLIRPSNSDVWAQLWKRIGWRKVVWEKHVIEGPESLIPQRICTHARTHWCVHVQNRTHTHTHARRHWRIKQGENPPKELKQEFLKNRKI